MVEPLFPGIAAAALFASHRSVFFRLSRISGGFGRPWGGRILWDTTTCSRYCFQQTQQQLLNLLQ